MSACSYYVCVCQRFSTRLFLCAPAVPTEKVWPVLGKPSSYLTCEMDSSLSFQLHQALPSHLRALPLANLMIWGVSVKSLTLGVAFCSAFWKYLILPFVPHDLWNSCCHNYNDSLSDRCPRPYPIFIGSPDSWDFAWAYSMETSMVIVSESE